MKQIPVLIAGAGPTGLVLALWLTKSGIAVRIFDKTAEAGTTSRALGVQAHTLELYRQMGIADGVLEGCVRVAGANFWISGTRVARFDIREIGTGLSPFPGLVTFAQDEHEKMLIAELTKVGVIIERQTELLKFEDRGTSIVATLKLPDGSEEQCEASYLAGCDGAHSAVRAGLGIGFPGGTYDALFYVADAQVTSSLTNDEAHFDLSATDFLAVFPLREMKLTVNKVSWFSTYRVHHRVADHFHIYGEVKQSSTAACAELQLPLHVLPWSEEAGRAGLVRSAFYLVRPDGYIALADADGGALGLRGYLSTRGLSVGSS